MDNARIADRLDAFASLLELAEANPYTAARLPPRRRDDPRRGRSRSPSSCGPGGCASCAGSGRGSRRGCASSSRRARSPSWPSSSASSRPELVGLGRYLGLGAKRSVEIARALGVRTADELREAAAAGRLRTVPGIGPKTEAQLLEALAREAEPRPQRGLLLNRARELVGGDRGRARRRGGRRRRGAGATPASSSRWSAPRRIPQPVLARFAALPQIVAVVEQDERRAVGRDRRGRAGRARRRRARSASAPRSCARPARPRTSRRSSRCRTRPTRQAVYRALGLPWCPPELREEPFRGEPPALVEPGDIRGDLHCHTTWSDGRASVEEMGRAARERGYDYLAICDHTPAVGAVRGLDRRRRPPPGRGDRGGERAARAVPRPARDRVRHPPRRPARPPRRRARRARLGAGERPRRAADAAAGDDQARRGGAAQPARALPQPSEGPAHQPPARRTRSTSSACSRSRSRRASRSRSTASPPRLDLSGEHVRDALRAGVRIVCSTDAHSVARARRTWRSRSHTARRGWATAADVVNTRPARAGSTVHPRMTGCRGRRVAVALGATLVASGEARSAGMDGISGLVLVVAGHVAVACRGPVRAISWRASVSRSTSSAVVPSPMLARTAPGSAGRPAGAQLGAQPRELRVRRSRAGA